MSSSPPSGASSVNEPAPAWNPQAEPAGGAAGEATGEATSASGAPESAKDPPGRPAGTIAAEARTAQADFHRAASRPAMPGGASQQGRSAALQAFFVANAGRGLLPSGETSGVLSPNLKTEES